MKFINIIEYVEGALLPFSEAPFNQVDSLVLSQFAYCELSSFFPDSEGSIALRDVFRAEHFPAMLAAVFEAERTRRLLAAMAASPRFRSLTLSHYVSEYDAAEGKQFSAVCVRIGEGLVYLAFRGTDDCLIGWKEDFSLAFKTAVPSQKRAAEYLAAVAAAERGDIILGGHSKGGNLAVYAAMTALPELQARLTLIYDHDGPGFKEGVLDCEGYSRIKDRIEKTVPQSSLVGMLLDGHDHYTVVECRRMGGVMQHNPFMWEVSPAGVFRQVEDVTGSAKYINTALRSWMAGLSDSDREFFVETLFTILDAGNAETLTDITREWRRNAKAMFAALKLMDPEMKAHLRELLRDFASQLSIDFRLRLPKRPQGAEPKRPN